VIHIKLILGFDRRNISDYQTSIPNQVALVTDLAF